MPINPPKESASLEQRKRSYIWLLVVMILSYVSLGPFSTLMPGSSWWPEATTFITVFVWYAMCLRVTFNFYTSRTLRVLYASFLVFQMLSNGYAVVLQANVGTVADLIVPASFAYAANFIGFGFVFYILLLDIFSQKHDLSYGLLGASNIYFMIPILFTYIYSLIAVHHPSFVGADPANISTVVINSFNYSWHVIASLDYPGQVEAPIQQIGVLESISGNLFVVFIIGRLMAK